MIFSFNKLELIFKSIIFTAHTTATKFSLGLSGVIFGALTLIKGDLFGFLILIYGIFQLWRISEDNSIIFKSLAISLAGACIWTSMAWAIILSPLESPASVAMSIGYAVASLWVLLRTGSSEILSNNCTANHRSTIKRKTKEC